MLYLIGKILTQEDLEFISSCGIPHVFISMISKGVQKEIENERFDRVVFLLNSPAEQTILYLRFGNRMYTEDVIFNVYNISPLALKNGVSNETKEIS